MLVRKIWLYIMMPLVLFSCDLFRGKEISSKSERGYQRIISTSVASDTMLVDLLSPNQLHRLIGLSSGFSSYGLDQTREELLNHSVSEVFTLEAMETIFFYQPDLIVASHWAVTDDRKELLSKFDISLHVLEEVSTLPQMYQQLVELAKLLGHETEETARHIIRKFREVEQSVDANRHRLSTYSQPIRVLDFNSSGYTATDNTTFALMMKLLGVENLGNTLSEQSTYGYAPINEEMLFLLDPDVLIVDSITAERLRKERVFRRLQAVQNNHIFEVDESMARLFYSPTYHMLFATVQLQERLLDWFLPSDNL
ncbi:ABC transporter substrate-binding protein [Entomospira entomophila]|uniref:ABC transporter substrate-binding protein n=1 Tax=Entomospira entomophila TaxID=2719988 RepID=A0A968G8Z4_9SPIO|nr:ABC transporter substrate-binding protein [Entomospira entomophilus]NIZ40760.1 ABC transporter substrate-binding protein [Entomospira entomophilus]WDI34974.1 ABC transporter substrate-binding protein [Entomospira entomophilus]